MQRVFTLDYLRGLCAFGIMIFHYLLFSGIQRQQSDNFLDRIGFYGVSIFYVLSGLTLYLVYYKRFNLKEFYIKRVFRIFPLLWVILTFSYLMFNRYQGGYHLLVSYSGAFGFIRWWDAVGTGVWSIGNELVFYALFPLILIPASRFRHWPFIISSVVLAIYVWFAFVELQGESMETYRRDYVNPLNQAGLFVIGFLIGYVFRRVEFGRVFVLILLTCSLLSFIFYPTYGSIVEIITGYNRIFFTIICSVLCLAFYKIDARAPVIDPLLTRLGEASYSLYLLHPIVWFGVASMFPKLSLLPMMLICIPTSLISSYLMYLGFEKRFIEAGNRLIGHYRSKKMVKEAVVKTPEHLRAD